MAIQPEKIIKDGAKLIVSLLVVLVLVFVCAILATIALVDVKGLSGGRPGYREMLGCMILLWLVIVVSMGLSFFAALTAGFGGILVVGFLIFGTMIGMILAFVAAIRITRSQEYKNKEVKAVRAFGFSIATAVILLVTIAAEIIMVGIEIHELRKHGAVQLAETIAAA